MEWIKCSDRNPEEYKPYLVYTIHGVIEVLRFEGKVREVTHWMQLPDKPNDEN